MNQTSDVQTEQHASQGPGDQLQAARISSGLTLADVANKMHLSESILSSLEENNFDDITAPIFVKGYLRSYARIVNVNEEEIIKQYVQFYTHGDPPISSTSNTSPEINDEDAHVKWISWLVIIGILVLLLVWWWNRYQQPAETVSLESGQQSETLADSNNLNIPDKDIDNTDMDQVADIQQQVQQKLAQEHSSVTETDAEEDSNPQSMEQTNLPITIEQEETPRTESQPTDSQPQEPEVTEAEPEPVQAPAEKGLRVEVNADTWVDIRDANGKKLVYDLIRAGESMLLEGKAPYKVFFGNGYGVNISFNGKQINFTDRIQSNNTAKLNIGR